MKKLFALILTLCLLCGAFALAEQSIDTHVTFELTENKTFTVMIPPTAEIRSTDKQGELEISLNAEDFNAVGCCIEVWLAGAKLNSGDKTLGNFLLTNETDATKTIPYHLYNSAGVQCSLGLMLSWTCGEDTEVVKSETLKMVANPANDSPVGKYSATLTFDVFLTDPQPASM